MADAEDKQLKAMEEQLEGVWKPRLSAAADPFENSLQRERVRRLAFLPASFHLRDLVTSSFSLESHNVWRGLWGERTVTTE